MLQNDRKTPIRVLIAHYLPDVVSGAERSIADFVQNADPSLLECVMLTPGTGSLEDFYLGRGFRVWTAHIETPRRKYPGLHLAQSLWLAARLKLLEVDFVMSNTFSAASRVGTAARLAGIPNAIYIREFISDRPLNRKILQRADGIMTISRDLQEYLFHLVDPQKLFLAYNYIDPAPILERARLHRASGKRVLPFEKNHAAVGLVGRITPFKQQDLLIQAAPKVLERFPEARFVIVGSARETEKTYEESLHRLVHELGLERQVTFLGQRQDVVEITTELAISCLTSDREPLGRVILEANIIGCPVIASDRGGPAEIIEDGRTGLLFPTSGADASSLLADRICCFLADPFLRTRLATAAREKIGVTFAGIDYVRRQEEIILSLYHSRQLSKQITRETKSL
ncbi:MAG TPA: glycosyltransferase family 4 protein [Anaerolineaceae bacterium]|nr:glycosyltransferase family 4 protein [Anaerolineaceae bacterium]